MKALLLLGDRHEAFLIVLLLSGILLLASKTQAWVAPAPILARPPLTVRSIPTTRLCASDNNNKFQRDLEERTYRRAGEKSSAGSMAAGAILGGMLGGPFGALFGAQIGANMGAKNAISQARKEEMERMGITQDMLEAAEETGYALQQSMEGLKATSESLRTQQSLARILERDATELYEKAKKAMTDGKEEAAREYLFERTKLQDRQKSVLKQCVEEKKRCEQLENNIKALEQRALEVESLLQRTVGAKARQSSFTDLSLSSEDPLLQKFKDLGID